MASRSRSNRRFNQIAVQSFIGAFCLLVYVVVIIYAMDGDPVQAIATVVPYLICYELGIFSRYIPGVRDAAKRLD